MNLRAPARYGAVATVLPLPPDAPVVVIGSGGVGQQDRLPRIPVIDGELSLAGVGNSLDRLAAGGVPHRLEG